MKILGLRVGRFHTGSRRRRKVPGAPYRITNAALLDAAVKNPEVLAQVIDKYGEIQIRRDDKIATLHKNIRDTVYAKAVQTILNSRKQKLTNRVNGIIDRLIGLNSVPSGRRHEEGSFEGVTPGGHESAPNTVRQRTSVEQSIKDSLDPSVLNSNPATLAALNEIVNQQRNKQTRGSLEE